MKILHTSDWHLGKNLERYSRIEEQAQFIEELALICNREEIDLIIVAGDIFDTSNPPEAAETLFYKALRVLSDDGKRPIIIIAGNHDNYKRLVACSPLAIELGVILVGSPISVVKTGLYGTNCEILESEQCCITVKIKKEIVVVITIPYPSEGTLNEIIFDPGEEINQQKSFSDKVEQLFKRAEANYKENTINIAIGHFYLIGGEITDSERAFSLGGIYAVNYSALPKKAQYIAMGHLHRNQKVKNDSINAFYCGSPIQYSKSEAKNKNYVHSVEILPKKEAIIKKVVLTNYKPIKIWKVNSIEEAICMCEDNKDENCYVYLEINTDKPLNQLEVKKMHSFKKHIIEILPIINNQIEIENILDQSEMNPLEEFKEFYYYTNNKKATEELENLFMEIWDENEKELRDREV